MKKEEKQVFHIEDPKGELLAKIYYPAIARGMEIVQLNQMKDEALKNE